MRTKPARLIEAPPRCINEIVPGERALTANTALRPGKFSGISAQFWLNLQTHYDLRTAEGRVADQIAANTLLKAA